MIRKIHATLVANFYTITILEDWKRLYFSDLDFGEQNPDLGIFHTLQNLQRKHPRPNATPVHAILSKNIYQSFPLWRYMQVHQQPGKLANL